jgi:glycosyltransferase involved in cell wall biosynthesis
MSEAVSPLFTILLPVVRPPVLLPFAIESVLAQSIPAFELLIVCDGAPPETAACAQDYARRDARIKVLSFPKGERNGEAHRHTALAGAAGRYVAHIADDDLWFPDHLAELEILLSKADFGHLLHVYLHPGGRAEILPSDIGLPAMRERMLAEAFNLFGPTVAGYRLAAYRALPEGWSPAPADVWNDLHMWRKFLRMENFVFATRAAVTALVFATPHRRDVDLEQRQIENRSYLERIRDPGRRNEIVEAAWHSLLDRGLQSERQVGALGAARDALANELARTVTLVAAKEDAISRMRGSRSWWLTAPLRKSFAIAARFRGIRQGG